MWSVFVSCFIYSFAVFSGCSGICFYSLMIEKTIRDLVVQLVIFYSDKCIFQCTG